MKPDREVFDRVGGHGSMRWRTRVLFLDDNLVNVEGAREAGFARRAGAGRGAGPAVLVHAGVLG